MIEEWRDVPAFPGYQASNLGRIKGKRGSILKPAIRLPETRRGPGHNHMFVVLMRKGNRHNLFVHRLVFAAFHRPLTDGELVRHIDGNEQNNSADNLTVGTYADNYADAVQHGTNSRGEINGRAGLTETRVRELRSRYTGGEPRQALAVEFGIDITHVWRIGTHRSWRHVA